MAFDAFISHSSDDKQAADATCAALEAAGIRCWIAPRDVRAGREYAEEIISAIDSCRVMVLIFSSSANASSQVRREIERAVSKGVTIVTMRIEDVLPSKSMEYYLDSLHWLDALTPPLAKHLQHLVDQVTANLSFDAAGSAPETQAQPLGTLRRANRTLLEKKGWARILALSSSRKLPLTAGMVTLFVILSIFGLWHFYPVKPTSQTQLDGGYVGKFTSSFGLRSIQSASRLIQSGKSVALTFETEVGTYGTGSGIMSSNDEGQFSLEVRFGNGCIGSYKGTILVLADTISTNFTGTNCAYNAEETIKGQLIRSSLALDILEAFRTQRDAGEYDNNDRLDDALLAATDYITIMKRVAAKDPGNSMWQQDITDGAGYIGYFAKRFMLAHQFQKALDCADLAISMASDKLWIYADRADALMFLNRADEARALFLKYANRQNAEGDKSWQAVVIERFDEMRDAGLTSSLMDEIEKQFAADK